ncbi:copper chaperone PCu(A)C [Ideonella sp. 4Y16]|uniref:copper chaperone PCu(A)C n=1 Tax=Ideonella alba TaxID=2824118 RepID=UPI001B397D64|nr:copper chaperone PCu(A)C [Ideonella alba]MBQ0946468.1 copper chaperone PCu(A)C [Ideonella alba]
MKLKHLAVAAFTASLSMSAALAQTAVSDAWVRGTVPAQKATGAFMQLKSAQGGRLLSVASPLAGVVEIHEMKMDGNVMKMAALPKGLELPAGQTVELKPGGYHVMLMDLKQPLKDGDSVPLSLVVEGKDGKRETIELKAPVRPLGAANPAPMHQH